MKFAEGEPNLGYLSDVALAKPEANLGIRRQKFYSLLFCVGCGSVFYAKTCLRKDFACAPFYSFFLKMNSSEYIQKIQKIIFVRKLLSVTFYPPKG